MRAMETKWLEDFVSLAETRSFSRSAQLRHVTQPAFSRRIQALEAWAGTDLVDRSSYPTRLTAAGNTLYDQALEVLQALQNTRAMLRAHTSAGTDMIEFAVPHTLEFTFFPAWVSALRADFGPLNSRLIALNVHDAVMRLVEGGCDLLISYHHPSQPLQLDPDRYEMVTLGQEVLAPYAKAGADGRLLQLTVYTAWWPAGASSVSEVATHTPEACWPGAGWTLLPEGTVRRTLRLTDGRVADEAEQRSFVGNGYPQRVWFWHVVDGAPLGPFEPKSWRQQLRLFFERGIRRDEPQVFARLSSNREWAEIADEPLVGEALAGLARLGVPLRVPAVAEVAAGPK
jgi:DNA-binding transcriptional LysR family regulator